MGKHVYAASQEGNIKHFRSHMLR